MSGLSTYYFIERYGMEEYRLNKAYFDELLDKFGKMLVGKVMKRFELSSNPTDIKIQTKNLIYEELRAFKQLLDAHAAGYEQVQWEFKQTKGKVENE